MKKVIIVTIFAIALIVGAFGGTLIATAQPEGGASPLEQILSLLGNKEHLIDIDGPNPPTIAKGVGDIWQKTGDFNALFGNGGQLNDPEETEYIWSIADAIGRMYQTGIRMETVEGYYDSDVPAIPGGPEYLHPVIPAQSYDEVRHISLTLKVSGLGYDNTNDPEVDRVFVKVWLPGEDLSDIGPRPHIYIVPDQYLTDYPVFPDPFTGTEVITESETKWCFGKNIEFDALKWGVGVFDSDNNDSVDIMINAAATVTYTVNP